MSMQVKRLNDISNLDDARAAVASREVAACEDPTYPSLTILQLQDFDCACLLLCHSVERPTAAAVNYSVVLLMCPACHR